MKNFCFTFGRKALMAIALLLTFSLPALAQKITVHGYVDDATGEPLIGASVMEKGTSNGTATDIDGNFTINVAPDATLVISYVGYNPEEVAVKGHTEIKVTLQENATMLAETVVIGYGSVKKSDATGSVAIVKPDEVEAGLATSVQDMLVGQTPGVVVTTAGGPSGSANIRIRGGASLSASNDPLIVLDGVPLSSDTPLGMGSPLAMIDPESIESMTVLKDASATAIYGSRASNGVIIITSKKGKAGRPRVSFAANFFVDYARKKTKVLDGDEFRSLIINKFGEGSGAANMLGDVNTNWQDQIFRTTFSSDYTLSVAGSLGQYLPYRISGSYTNNNGILKGSSMDRATVGITLSPKLFDNHLSINATAKGYYVHNNWGQTDAIGQAVSFNPTIPIYDYQPVTGGTASDQIGYLFNGYNEPYTVTGGQVNLENNATYNPVATIAQADNYSNVYRSNGNIQFDYSFHFLPELHANLNLGYDVTKSNDYYFAEANSHMAWKENEMYGGGYGKHEYAFRSNTLLEFYLNYKKEFEAAQSMLDVTAGYTWSRDYADGRKSGADSNTNYATTMGLSPAIPTTDGFILNWTPGTEGQVDQPFKRDDISEDGKYHWANHLQLLSFFGRVNYSYKDRYLLTATVRGDATSRFSKENRWGVFPAVALGWRIDQEEFLKDNNVLSDLKLRLGWGETGQQAVGSYYNYLPLYNASQPGSYYPNGMGGWFHPIFPNGYNKDLKWETTTTWNVGIDYGFLNNRVSGSIEYYIRKTRDLLSNVPVSAGASTVAILPQNIGDMENYGIEFNISAKPIVTDDFVWTLGYNVGWNHNEITNLGGNEFAVGGGFGGTGGNCMVQREGYPAYTFNLYQQVYD
ncbi:MAG: SusC/RagA family TonB-linked outer membrane protein, partial [Muribaculaceae bacterium]|nr:SusC/RagA family TonB-linked outer membrane protein [Muribaculaceae bacterium]